MRCTAAVIISNYGAKILQISKNRDDRINKLVDFSSRTQHLDALEYIRAEFHCFLMRFMAAAIFQSLARKSFKFKKFVAANAVHGQNFLFKFIK